MSSSPVTTDPAARSGSSSAWEEELHLLVRHGTWAAFPHLRELLRWPPYLRAGGTLERATGVQVLEEVLRAAVTTWCTHASDEAQAMSALLGLGQRSRRVLNGPQGLRAAAGRRLNDVGWDQFSRHYEGPLVERFAAFLRSQGTSASMPGVSTTTLSFQDMEHAAATLHRVLERQFRPEVVLTLSGPGSFTACYLMRLDPRDVPVVMATTFPLRGEPEPAEVVFASASRASGGRHVTTSKWSIYLPAVLDHLRPGCRVAIVDDRVLSGETHTRIRGTLQDRGYEVACAALFADPSAPVPGLLIGREVVGAFEMPWGPATGRD